MIKSINGLVTKIKKDLNEWESQVKPWFRGESGDGLSLCPKIASFNASQENYLMQSFRRQAGGLVNVPARKDTDLWLFLAQHYGLPTRLIDWTEGALLALYFAINQNNPNPIIYMLNPQRLNELAGVGNFQRNRLNYPLSSHGIGAKYVAYAWEIRKLKNHDSSYGHNIPIAFPATYQDQRMIAQRSCFTIHGINLKPINEILTENQIKVDECLFEYKIDDRERKSLLRDLSFLGVSAASIFPDLDHLAADLKFDIKNRS